MAQGDRFHQRQTQSDAPITLGRPGQTVKGLENAIAQFSRDARATVADPDHGLGVGLLQRHADFAGSVTARILQQVAHDPAQQLGHALHRQGSIGIGLRTGGCLDDQFRTNARAFLGRQADQVDRLDGAQIGLPRVEPAGQQDFFDQLVELGDIALDFILESGRRWRTHQFHAHPDAGQG